MSPSEAPPPAPPPTAPEPPDAPEAPAPRVGPFLLEKLRALDALLAETAPRVLEAADDRAVHDLRVALRRTRTLLEVGAPVLGAFQAEETRRALRGVMQATGALRDDEVLLELVEELGVRHPDVTAWLTVRRVHERRLRGRLVRAVRDGALEAGRRLLEALVAFRVDPRRDRRLGKFARRAVDRARRRVDRRRDAPIDDAEALHDLRIAFKRLRYTAQTFRDVLPAAQASLAQPASRFQSRLGALHDVDVALVCVRRARALGPQAKDALLAALMRERQARLDAYLEELRGPDTSPGPAPTALQPAGSDSLRKISTR